MTSHYHMGVRREPVSEGDNQYSGTVVGNYTGSEWEFYQQKDGESEQLARMYYDGQMRCSSDPRGMQVYLISPFYQYDDL